MPLVLQPAEINNGIREIILEIAAMDNVNPGALQRRVMNKDENGNHVRKST